MKRLMFLIVFITFTGIELFSQYTISGVVKDENGEPLPGVHVRLKENPGIGTITNQKGEYSLNITKNTSILVFSFIGMKTQEVAVNNQSVINVTLIADAQNLDDVVVTALGITRNEKSIGYSIQEVSGNDLTTAGETNMVSSLAGKVSGIQMIGTSGALIGGSAKINIRGVNALTVGDPLYVVDGTPISNENYSDSRYRGYDIGNLATDVNPEDIETITVLKGSAATALYGERANNGVIMITTKKGKKRAGIGIDFSSSLTFEKVYILPEYQNEYGGGYDQDYLRVIDPVDGLEYNALLYAADESWGPPMDGTLYRPWWSWHPGRDYGEEIAMLPQPDNVRSFFETGKTNINSIAFSGGLEKITYRLAYTNLNQAGIMPNSTYKKNTLGLNLSAKITHKLTVSTSLNMAFIEGKGRPAFGYYPVMGNALSSFNQWFQRQLNMEKLADYKSPDGTFRSWNMRSHTDLRPLYWDSPYFTAYENYETDGRNRYYGFAKLAYQFNEHFLLSAAIRKDNHTQRIEERIATGGVELDSYAEFVANGREGNYEILANYNNQWNDFSIEINVGGNLRQNKQHMNWASTQGGLSSANFFNMEASVDRPELSSFIQNKQVRSLYGSLDFAYKNFIYLGFTARNDWSSALPVNNNSYLYPSVNLGFVFSELIKPNHILSFAKIRANIAQVGSDTDPYIINQAFSIEDPYGNKPAFSVPDLLPNKDLVPALTTSWELGCDIRFLKDRLGLDFTYYTNFNKNQIMEIQVSGASGYRKALINAGEIVSKGWELSLHMLPVKGVFNWDMRFNIAHNYTVVEKLDEEGTLQNYRLAGGTYFSLNAELGKEWGIIRGSDYTYLDGQKVITNDGSFVRELNKNLGSALPNFTGGYTNSFSYNNFTLNAHLDFQLGGKFYSVTKAIINTTGLGIETVALNNNGVSIREDLAYGGGVLVEGVLEDGTPHSIYVTARTYYSRMYSIDEEFMYDASFVKLRELSLSYSLPQKTIRKSPFSSISIALIAKNLWLIYSNIDGLDPSEILPGANNLIYFEGAQLPGVRSFGFKLSIGL